VSFVSEECLADYAEAKSSTTQKSDRTAEKDQRKITAAKAAEGREKSKGVELGQNALRIVRESTEEK